METDTLIIGGGLAGLSLADRLTSTGARFLVIEAQERLGGRILSEAFEGARFDLGPAWFWHGQPQMDALTRRFDLPVFEQYAAGDLIHQDASGVVQRGRGYASMAGSLRVNGGMGAVVDALAKTVGRDRLLLNTKVTSITREDGAVAADLERFGTPLRARAQRIVLAVPPRVVAHTIDFAPSLDAAATEAMRRIPTWMAGQAKILAVYDTPHWRNAGLSGDALSQRGPMVEIHDASPMSGGPYALFSFVGVPPEIRAQHPEELKRMALSQFVELFGPAMSAPRRLILKDWATTPELATPLDRAPVRNHPAYGTPPVLRGLWDGRLHLSSTEMGRGFGGFLEGALEAAEATAKALTAPLPQVA